MIQGKITETPGYSGECIMCGKCLSSCPGLAITLVDLGYDDTGSTALVMVPWEMPKSMIKQGMEVTTSGFEGEVIGKGKVIAIKNSNWQNLRSLVALEVPKEKADLVAGIRLFNTVEGEDVKDLVKADDDIIICRCERVTKKEIKERIRAGARDFNAIKAATRICMGECGGKTCTQLIWQIFREEGIDLKEVEAHIERAFVSEVHLSAFLGGDKK
jgi:bacterioferritin-associated ferredoxin